VTGLPGPLARTARESVSAGAAVARSTGDAALASSAGHAYVQAMTTVMLTSAGVGLLGMVLAATLLPARRAVQTPREESATIPV